MKNNAIQDVLSWLNEEIITLKEKGVSDEVLQSVIEASRSEDQDDRDRAWRMLENMDLEIHTRGQR